MECLVTGILGVDCSLAVIPLKESNTFTVEEIHRGDHFHFLRLVKLEFAKIPKKLEPEGSRFFRMKLNAIEIVLPEN